MLRGWGVNRFSIAWGTPHTRRLFDQLERWGYDINIYAVPDLAASCRRRCSSPLPDRRLQLPAVALLGRGSGEHLAHHTYRLDRPA